MKQLSGGLSKGSEYYIEVAEGMMKPFEYLGGIYGQFKGGAGFVFHPQVNRVFEVVQGFDEIYPTFNKN